MPPLSRAQVRRRSRVVRGRLRGGPALHRRRAVEGVGGALHRVRARQRGATQVGLRRHVHGSSHARGGAGRWHTRGGVDKHRGSNVRGGGGCRWRLLIWPGLMIGLVFCWFGWFDLIRFSPAVRVRYRGITRSAAAGWWALQLYAQVADARVAAAPVGFFSPDAVHCRARLAGLANNRD
jgi:hypothetical protein